MNPEDWKHIEELYCATLEREPAEREVLLDAASPEVRQAVERMLTSSSDNNILDRTPWIDSEPVLPRVTLKAGTQMGPYTILGLIGEGGMSSVYGASDLRLNREVAVKILPQSVAGHQNRLHQFELEARAAGSLNHPNILTVHDVGSHEGSFYLVTELLNGETLRARINRGKLSRQDALAYARMVAAGLVAAHDKGIIHRDLKPENLFVTRDGRLKILDFGLAKFSAPEGGAVLMKSPEEDAPRSLSAMLVGTVGYMSSEQVQGLPIDTRSDIFNVGIVVFEMVTGLRPFSGATPLQTLREVLEKEPKLNDLPEIDSALARFLRRCLEKDPRDRFQSAGDMLLELESLDAPSSTLLSRRWVGLYLGGGVAVAGLAWIASRAAAPRPASPRQLTSGLRGNIVTGRFTPDGRTIVFSAGLNGRPVETFRISTEGGEIVPLRIPRSGIASISAKGDLALLLECKLNWGECSGRLARRTLAGGELEFDEFDEPVEFADWSPNGDLAIIRVRRGRMRIEYPIGERLVENRSGWISHLRFSPQGDRLAFFNHPDLRDNRGSVEVVDLKGTRTTLVSGRQGLKGLAWTPAGDEVWFTGSDRERAPQLLAVNLDRRERTVRDQPGWFDILDIAHDGGVLMMDQRPTSWIKYFPEERTENLSIADWADVADVSADGKQLLVYEWGRAQAGKRFARLHDTAQGGSRRLGEGRPLALSPDGQWVLAARDFPNAELVVFPVKSGNERRLPNPGVEGFLEGVWVNGDNVTFAATETDGSIRSYVQSVNGGAAQPITGHEIRVALVSPDRTELAAYGNSPEAYYRLSISGEKRGSFPGLEPYDELLQWGRDGLYVRGRNEDQINLFRVDPASGDRTPLPSPVLDNSGGFLGIGTTRITRDGSVVVYNYWNAFGDLYLFEGLK